MASDNRRRVRSRRSANYFLVPLVGDFRSRQIGVFTGSIRILAVAYLFVPWLRTTEPKALIRVGALWLLLIISFELSFGHFIFRRSWEDLARDYNIFRGGLLPVGLAVLMVAPVIAVRMREGR
jgi:hypothetical protein